MKTPGEARTKLLEIGRQLSAYDFKGGAVQGISKNPDGATFFWPDAFALEWFEWIFVFTEHYGYYEFHREDMVIRIFNQESAIENAKNFIPDARSTAHWAEQGHENPAERYVTKSTPVRHSDR